MAAGGIDLKKVLGKLTGLQLESSDITTSNTPATLPGGADVATEEPFPDGLDVKFRPGQPKRGLTIKNVFGAPGRGFIDVWFVDCTWDPSASTVFDNCFLLNVTFKNCDFRGAKFHNVVMRSNTFHECTFRCSWYNYKLTEGMPFETRLFSAAIDHSDQGVPQEIKERSAARQEIQDAAALDRQRRLAQMAQKPDIGIPEGYETDQSSVYTLIPPSQDSAALATDSVIPSGLDISFHDTPRAGLTVRNGKGSFYEAVNFTDCKFDNAIFDTCYFRGATFKKCIFKDVVLTEVALLQMSYESCVFTGCKWKRRRFEGGKREYTKYAGDVNDGKVPTEITNQARIENQKMVAVARPTRTGGKRDRRRNNPYFPSPEQNLVNQLPDGDRAKIYIKPGAADAGDVPGTTFFTPKF